MFTEAHLEINCASDIQSAGLKVQNVDNGDVPRQARDHSPRRFDQRHVIVFGGREAMSKPKARRMAPEVGFEPTTNRLTADRSTTELLWIVVSGGIERRECCAERLARQVIWLRGRPRHGGARPSVSFQACPLIKTIPSFLAF